VFVSLCGIEAPEDGLTFLPESVQVEAIREDQEYGGMRVRLMAMLGNVRSRFKLTSVRATPLCHRRRSWTFQGSSTSLEHTFARTDRRHRSPRRRRPWCGSPLANSRMKDFFDIHRLAETRTFDGETMRLAVAATFARRGIDIPSERPLALTSDFAEDAQKKVQWAAFVRRTRRPDPSAQNRVRELVLRAYAEHAQHLAEVAS